MRASGEYTKSSVVSGHRHGKSFDLKFARVSPQKVQEDIKSGNGSAFSEVHIYGMAIVNARISDSQLSVVESYLTSISS